MLIIYGKGKTGYAVKELADSLKIENTLVDDTDFNENLLKSAKKIVVSPGVPFNHRIYKLAKKHNIDIEGEIEFANRYFNGDIIAITGTDGKSTTTKMIHHLIGEENASIGGNYGIPFSEIVLKEPNKDAVLELSSFQIYSTKNLKPKIAVFLNISTDHLDWHKKFCHYKLSKYKLFKNMDNNDIAILNYDNKDVRETPTVAKKYFFSLNKLPSDIKGAYFDGEKIVVQDDKNRFSVKLPKSIKGIHNIQNTMASVLTAYLYGVDKDTIENRLESFKPLPFRMEYLGSINGVDFYNDAKSTTLQSLEMALKSFDGKRVHLIAGGINKGADFSKLNDLISKKVKKAVLIGRDRESIKNMLGNSTEIVLRDSLKDAVLEALKDAKEGDVILFSPACASFDMFKNYIDRGEKFNQIFNELKNA